MAKPTNKAQNKYSVWRKDYPDEPDKFTQEDKKFLNRIQRRTNKPNLKEINRQLLEGELEE